MVKQLVKKDRPNLAEALSKGTGIEVPFRCDDHDDRHASASVNLENGLWTCYSCGAGGRVDASGLTPRLSRYLNHLKGVNLPPVYPPVWLDMFDSVQTSPYWSDRVGAVTARKYRCGTDPYHGTPTYPIHDYMSNVLGVVSRHADQAPKYLYPYGVPVSHHLFGMHLVNEELARRLVIVEGAPDVMELDPYARVDTYVLGCYGAGLHVPQVELINELAPDQLVLAFDNDDAGRYAASRDYDLSDLIDVVRFIYPPGVKDAGEADEATRKELVG